MFKVNNKNKNPMRLDNKTKTKQFQKANTN